MKYVVGDHVQVILGGKLLIGTIISIDADGLSSTLYEIKYEDGVDDKWLNFQTQWFSDSCIYSDPDVDEMALL